MAALGCNGKDTASVEALESVMCDAIEIRLKGGDATRSKIKIKAPPNIW